MSRPQPVTPARRRPAAFRTVRTGEAVRDVTTRWRQAGDRIALVPTMGNLHAGHMSLVSLALSQADRVIVSVFVNPTQFGPGEDYASYPRTLDNDRRRLGRSGVDLLFTPSVEDIYPSGISGSTTVSVPGLSTVLCGQNRPGHFDGVTSVVARLLNIAQPHIGIFGQKDFQQFVIIRRMVADLHLPVAVHAGPTQREKDGLALSSRNQYLGADERARAPAIYTTLNKCRDELLAGGSDYAALEAEGSASLHRAGLQPDYFAIRCSEDLAEPKPATRDLVVLTAARLGRARLIDNVLVQR